MQLLDRHSRRRHPFFLRKAPVSTLPAQGQELVLFLHSLLELVFAVD